MGEDVPAVDAPSGETGLFQVFGDGFAGGGVGFDEVGGGGAAAEGLEAEGARAGEEVEDARAGDEIAEGGEERLAHPVGGGAGEGSGDLERDAARAAGDDAHGSVRRQD